ncbi:MAG TPA: biotin carboxylase N-terminal domain-containing protein [Nitriliruptorales bacterium]
MSDTTSDTDAAFDTVLVANRGEIAVRVMRTAAALGYRTVAVHSDADADAPHVHAADDAVRLGPAAARESYLDIGKVVAAAQASGAGAIHPGYGFLSENAEFAEACADAGIVFVGPTPGAIRLMGDKAAAKRRMAAAGVPLLPGYTPPEGGQGQDDATMRQEAERIGYPLMVKAAAGGGGKGMRLVASAAVLDEALAAARREAAAAFGSDVLILERALLRPRHVEVQVLADQHGRVVALGERDCSVQRRHQKVVEEAPCPALDPETRAAMQQAAVAAAEDIGYVGAGTVEFLLGRDGTFAFLEMNTRLQVEHPVTELVTGLDLVAWQLRIARGERLTLTQQDVRLDGHAIEARLYAEDPANGHLPQSGPVHAWEPPSGDGIRVDAGVAAGGEITAHYDPMIAKIVAHGRDRDEARRRLADALDRTTLLGPTTNRTFLAAILRHPVFAAGQATTAFLLDHDIAVPGPGPRDLAVVAGWLHLEREAEAARRSPGLAGWTNAASLRTRQRLQVGDDVTEVALTRTREALTVTIGERDFDVVGRPDGVVVDGRRVHLTGHRIGPDRVLVRLPHLDLDVRDVLHAAAAGAGAAGAGVLLAPMHGAVIAVEVAAGDPVSAGDMVLVMEAMKMEHLVRADVDGTIAEVVAVGSQVADRDVVARIEPADA